MDTRRHKAAHLTSVHSPTDPRIVHKECATLAQAGYEVVLIAPGDRPALPEGVRFHPVRVPRNRIERMTRTVWSVFRAARQERADVYHFHDPELMFVGIALRMTGARVVFDVHEDIPYDIVDKPWIAAPLRKPVAFAATLVLNCFERFFSAIVAATPSIAKRFAHDKTVVIANFPKVEEFTQSAPSAFSERPKTALYLGSITSLRSIEELVAAYASPYMGKDIRLTLAGEFETSELEQRVRNAPGWSRVDYLGKISRSELAGVMGASRMGILMFRPALSVQEAAPTKLFEYMAASLPIIISSSLAASSVVQQFECGLVVDPLDPDAIARAITFLAEHPEIAQAMGQRGYRLVTEQYQWTSEGRKLTELYAQIA